MLRAVLAHGAVALIAFAVLPNVDARAEPATEAAAPAPSLDEEACQKLWNNAAGRSDLGPAQAERYVTAFEKVDANGDHKITNKEFKLGCAAGFVHKPAKTVAPAGETTRP